VLHFLGQNVWVARSQLSKYFQMLLRRPRGLGNSPLLFTSNTGPVIGIGREHIGRPGGIKHVRGGTGTMQEGGKGGC